MKSELPKLSIVTPSYNQGHFIEETICSVLDQGYLNYEYIIIDGGSTDNTVDIIKKYESHLTYWVSEPDRGQAHAINKGLAHATGEIIAYINSDDYYLPNAFAQVAEAFLSQPETDLLHGHCRYVNEIGQPIGKQEGNITRFDEVVDLWNIWWKQRQFVQPEVFWSRRIFQKIGYFNESLFYGMDYDYWCRIFQASGVVRRIDNEIACFRKTAHQKSNQSQEVAIELLKIVQSFLWSKKTHLPVRKRLELQAQWLYQSKLLKQIDQSVKCGTHPLLRQLHSGLVLMQYPKIALSTSFQVRAKKWVSEWSR